MNVKACIEALLFATDQPLTLARIHEVLPDVPRDEVAQALAALEAEQETAERALRVQRVAGGLQLVTKPEYADVVRRLFVGKRRVRLTKPALEALAIIAYKQPTTRPEIDAIRGVSSGGVVETLLERNLVRIAGRADSVGRPLLYATSSEFLQYLGLDSLRDLPSLEELEAMLAAREDEARRQEEDELRELSQAAPPADDTAHAAARIEEEAPAPDLPSLEDLDVELRQHADAIDALTARVKGERRTTTTPPLGAEPEGDAEATTESEAG
jgi:segregation and condensation protein B